MTLSDEVIASLAEHVENAELNKTAITKTLDGHPGMDREDTYAIQYAICQLKLDRVQN